MEFHFDDKCKEAFETLKGLLASASIMQPPNWNVPFEIMCDASDYDIGVVFGQRVGKASHAIYYAYQTLNDAQLNYSTKNFWLLFLL